MDDERARYWDVDRCAWVGPERTHHVLPSRPVEVAHDGMTDVAVPVPRSDSGVPASPR